jgi:hypothetical protein
MSEHSTINGGWQDVPDGKIGALSARLRKQERRPVAVRIVAPTLLFLLSGVLAVQITHASYIEQERNNRIGGISCSDVVRQADNYIIGKITGSLRTDIGFHLSNCPNCSKQVRGIAKRDVLGELLGANSSAPAPRTISQRKKWCEDSNVPTVRQPVVAQKVFASASK